MRAPFDPAADPAPLRPWMLWVSVWCRLLLLHLGSGALPDQPRDQLRECRGAKITQADR
jgi:hypothetical protein